MAFVLGYFAVGQRHQPATPSRRSTPASSTGHQLDHWYINFQAPYHRTADGFDTVDHGIDIVIGEENWRWKDRDHVADQVRIGRLTPVEAQAVRTETERMADALNNSERWWLPRWASWQPNTP
jgi:hypothetical protein